MQSPVDGKEMHTAGWEQTRGDPGSRTSIALLSFPAGVSPDSVLHSAKGQVKQMFLKFP